ncbi:MAG: flagellar hook protein FlgE [Deferrisomatales bacterium]
MLRSFFSGVSGLRNHQQAMDVVGNNLANVNTVGFKSSRVTFQETLSQTVQGGLAATGTQGGRNPMQVGLGVAVGSVGRSMEQGALQTTGNNLDVAMEGKGFLIVGSGESYFYTRGGSLSLDDNFNLVTDTGDRVYGWVDTDRNGLVESSRDEARFINLDRRGDGRITNVLASATPPTKGPNSGDGSLGQVVTFATTVSDQWKVVCVDAATGTFEVVGAVNGSKGFVTVGDTFTSADVGTFAVNGGVPGRSTLSLDTNGDGTSIALTAKDFGAGGNQISLATVNRGSNQGLGVTVEGTKVTVSLATDALGRITSTEAEVAAALQAHPQASLLFDVVGGDAGVAAVSGNRFLAGGSGANHGDYFTFTTTAPGGAALETLTISKDGAVVGIFDNGTTEQIARLAVAAIPNPVGLLAVGAGKYSESPSSGRGFPPVIAGSGGTGTVASGFLEMSNVDMTREFTEMITTQRGFQANSRIITTSDEMLQELLTLKR